MQYVVIGHDGREYGPTEFRVLQQWATDNRLSPDSQLKEVETGRLIKASELSDLFPKPEPPQPVAMPPQDWSQPPQAQRYRPMPAGNSNAFWGVVLHTALGLILFFVLHGFGLVLTGLAVYRAVQLKSSGSTQGGLALAIALMGLLIVLAGWLLRIGPQTG